MHLLHICTVLAVFAVHQGLSDSHRFKTWTNNWPMSKNHSTTQRRRRRDIETDNQLPPETCKPQTDPSKLTTPTDCYDIMHNCGTTPQSGIYKIHPWGAPAPFDVYCDHDTDGGGWTVFQRRMDGSVGFYRTWEEYGNGFGLLGSEFWLGNWKLHYLTGQGDYELQVDLVNSGGSPYYARYNKFRVGDLSTRFRLILGSYSGTAGSDALRGHNGMNFTTKDLDNDNHRSNCAVMFQGAWWYHACHASNLNGLYGVGGNQGIRWSGLPGDQYNIKRTEMKVRPVF